MTTFFVLIIYVLLDDNNMYIKLNDDELDKLFSHDLSWIEGNDFCIVSDKLVQKLKNIHQSEFKNIETEEKFLKKSLLFFRYYILSDADVFTKKYQYRISSQMLRKFFPNKKEHKITYIKYVQSFEKYGIISKLSNYSTTYNVTNKYCFNESLFLGDLVLALFKNDELEDYDVKNEVPELNDKVLLSLSKLKLDLKSAIKEQYQIFKNKNENERLICRINRITVFNFNKNRYCFYGKKNRRIYHPICFLPKESRKHLNVSFNVLDIVNCQPLLLCYYLKLKGLKYDDEFIKNVENGMLYESLKDRLVDVSRDEVKQMVYSEILFDFKTAKKNEVNKVFKEIYPLTYSSLEDIHFNKKITNITLASILQNLEADLFNNLNVINSDYYFTLFDAIYYNDKSDEDDLRTQIDDYFKNLDLRVKVSDK